MDIIFSSFIFLYLFLSRKHWCLSNMHAYFPHKYHIPHNRFEVINQYYKSEPFCKIIEKEITICIYIYAQKESNCDCWLIVALIYYSSFERCDRKLAKNVAKNNILWRIKTYRIFSFLVANFLFTPFLITCTKYK